MPTMPKWSALTVARSVAVRKSLTLNGLRVSTGRHAVTVDTSPTTIWRSGMTEIETFKIWMAYVEVRS